MSELVSNCCGAAPLEHFETGMSTEDIGICPDCREHCEYIDLDDIDPTPWCHICGAMEKKDCDCGDYAANH